jgi:branched-chain amino acid transport system ATP-binding protein
MIDRSKGARDEGGRSGDAGGGGRSGGTGGSSGGGGGESRGMGLVVSDLRAGYGSSLVLQGVDLQVDPGEAIAVMGRNGVGKTTLVHSLMGMLRPRSGSVRFEGQELAGSPAHEIARRGLGLVPQGRRIFTGLSVGENLGIARRRSAKGWTLERVYEFLPRLAERSDHRGDQLSGGEQQMLAIGRALLGNPRLLLLDEPSEGLAPRLVESVMDIIVELRSGGLGVLLIEQSLHAAGEIADRIYVMEKGQIVHESSADEFRHHPERVRSLLGVA